MGWLTKNLSGIGTAIGGLFGYKGQKDTNVASAQQAQKQMDFQREMSNTAVQRRMADLQKAGINPILAGSKEASSPAGQQAPVGNKAQAAMNSAQNAATLENLIATYKKIQAETSEINQRILRNKLPSDVSGTFSEGFSSAKDYSRTLGSRLQALKKEDYMKIGETGAKQFIKNVPPIKATRYIWNGSKWIYNKLYKAGQQLQRN
jgi:hypothetical protein